MIALAAMLAFSTMAHAEDTATGNPKILRLSPGERIMSVEEAKAHQEARKAQRKAIGEQKKAETEAAVEAKKAEVQKNVSEKQEKVRERVKARKAEIAAKRAERKAQRQKSAEEINSRINTLKNTVSQ